MACGADLVLLKVMLGEGKSFRLYIFGLASLISHRCFHSHTDVYSLSICIVLVHFNFTHRLNLGPVVPIIHTLLESAPPWDDV